MPFLDNQWVRESGWCLDPEGSDQETEIVHLPNYASIEECFSDCKSHLRAEGCQYYTNLDSIDHTGCYYHTTEVVAGDGDSNTYCWIKQSSNIKIKHQYLYSAFWDLAK